MQLLDTVRAWPYVSVAIVGLGVLHRAPVVTAMPEVSVSSPAEADIATSVADDAPPAPRADKDVELVFTAGGSTWLALADVDVESVTKHGASRQVTDDYTHATIAPVAELPDSARGWQHRDVVVDGRCHDTLEQFAIVSRLSGDPAYANIDNDGQWTAKAIDAHGTRVLAAKLVHCTGTYARAATTMAAQPFVRVTDKRAVAKARAAMLASGFAAKARAEWKHTGTPWLTDTTIDTLVVRDPRSNQVWISAHAHSSFSCGGPNANFWGLFRVGSDGELAQVELHELDNIESIDALVDLDGDGVPELFAKAFLEPASVVLDANGDELRRLETPYFGCPC